MSGEVASAAAPGRLKTASALPPNRCRVEADRALRPVARRIAQIIQIVLPTIFAITLKV